MLKTNKLTRQIKTNMNQNGYNYVENNMKKILFKEELVNSICEELNIKNRGEYTLEDTIALLDRNTTLYGVNRDIFSSYIYATLNILGEMQGSMISWNQTEEGHFDDMKVEYDEYGFVKEIKTNVKSKPASVLMFLVDNLEEKPKEKLLVK